MAQARASSRPGAGGGQRKPSVRWAASRSAWYGFRVVEARSNLRIDAGSVGGLAPVEWRTSDGRVGYEAALAVMEARAAAIADGRAGELAWLIEHPPLYTAGTSARPQELIEARFPVHMAGRGGQLTYHGPGQRVVYLMLDLRRRGPDVRRFVATLEEWIIRTLAQLGIAGERREDRIGVWVRRPELGPGREDKIAAIGVRIRRWVTLHGVALNVEASIENFELINACGVAGMEMTSLVGEAGHAVTVGEAANAFRAAFAGVFDCNVREGRPPGWPRTSPGEGEAADVESGGEHALGR